MGVSMWPGLVRPLTVGLYGYRVIGLIGLVFAGGCSLAAYCARQYSPAALFWIFILMSLLVLVGRQCRFIRLRSDAFRSHIHFAAPVKLVNTLLIATVFGGCAQARASDYITEADRFLAVEVPKMEAAVTANDREYFKSGLERVKIFVGQNWAELDTSPSCTNAVTDFLIVGLCQISPPGSICEPKTFFPKFEANLAMCRAAAKAKEKFEPSLGH